MLQYLQCANLLDCMHVTLWNALQMQLISALLATRQPAMCPLESHTIVRKIGIIGQGAHSAPYAFICLDRSERATAGDVRCFFS